MIFSSVSYRSKGRLSGGGVDCCLLGGFLGDSGDDGFNEGRRNVLHMARISFTSLIIYYTAKSDKLIHR